MSKNYEVILGSIAFVIVLPVILCLLVMTYVIVLFDREDLFEHTRPPGDPWFDHER